MTVEDDSPVCEPLEGRRRGRRIGEHVRGLAGAWIDPMILQRPAACLGAVTGQRVPVQRIEEDEYDFQPLLPDEGLRLRALQPSTTGRQAPASYTTACRVLLPVPDGLRDGLRAGRLRCASDIRMTRLHTRREAGSSSCQGLRSDHVVKSLFVRRELLRDDGAESGRRLLRPPGSVGKAVGTLQPEGRRRQRPE